MRSGSVTPTRGTPFMDIPYSGDSEAHPIYSGTDSDASFLVGSPDQIQYLTPPRPSNNHLGTTSAPRARPALGGRSTSTPLAIRRRAMSTNQRITSGVMGLRTSTPQPEHQWTLFGQLMENERQIHTPRRRPTSTRHNVDLDGTVSETGSLTARRSYVDPFLDIQSVPEEGFGDSPLQSRRSTRPPSVQEVLEEEYNSDSDSGSDSDDSESDEQPASPTSLETSGQPSWFSLHRIPAIPVVYRNVLKCSIAYLIASLFTFSPHLSNLMSDLTSYGPGPHRPFPSGHMVATM